MLVRGIAVGGQLSLAGLVFPCTNDGEHLFSRAWLLADLFKIYFYLFGCSRS